MEEIHQHPNPDSREPNEKWNELADEIETLKQGDDRIINKLVTALRAGDVQGAKLFCTNEMDKFSEYRSTIVPLLITKLYGGNGSPWFTTERKMRGK